MILLVEDDGLKAKLLRKIIASTTDEEVVHVATLVDAVAVLSYGPAPRAVVTDWNFPRRDGGILEDSAGATVVRRCRELGLPVAVVSGSPRQRDDVEWIGTDWMAVQTWLHAVFAEGGAEVAR